MTDLHLELKHIQKSYLRPVLSDVNLDVTNGSYVTIVGKSGSGKSTMLNILGLVEGYDRGEYWFNGKLIRNGIDYSRLRLENIGFKDLNRNIFGGCFPIGEKVATKLFIAPAVEGECLFAVLLALLLHHKVIKGVRAHMGVIPFGKPIIHLLFW